MNITNTSLPIKNSLLCLLSMFFTVGICLAAEDDNRVRSQLPVELNATIMEINLSKNKMIIGETDILLESRIEDGKKIWLTGLFDAKHKEIPIETFKHRDRVLVQGIEIALRVMEAHNITLLEPAVKNQSQAKPQKTKAPTESTIHKEGGVWKN